MLGKLLRAAFGRREPEYQAHWSLAVRLERKKRLTEALDHYRAVLALMLPGRQTISFLRNLKLDALVTADEDAYVAGAVGLARDLDALAGLRASLRERMRGSKLMDYAGFTRDLESAYEAMLPARSP